MRNRFSLHSTGIRQVAAAVRNCEFWLKGSIPKTPSFPRGQGPTSLEHNVSLDPTSVCQMTSTSVERFMQSARM